MEISELNLSVRAANAVMRVGIKDVAELHSRFQNDAAQLQKDIGSKNLMEVKEALLSYDDTAVDVYSLVDEETATFLRNATAKIANSFADVGAVLAEAQERLAKHGFGEENGVFEKWYTSLGMKKFTVYTFIRIHTFRNETLRSCEFRTNGNALEIFDNLPKTLQADISSPSAPAEAVSAVLSGDITTHKDFVALKKELEETKERNSKLVEDGNRLFDDIKKEHERNNSLESRVADLGRQNDRLTEEIKELRNRPIETVTVESDPTQSEAYRALLEERNRMHMQITAATQENTRLKESQQTLIGKYSEMFERMRNSESPGAGYFIPMNRDEYNGIRRLLGNTEYAELMEKARFIEF